MSATRRGGVERGGGQAQGSEQGAGDIEPPQPRRDEAHKGGAAADAQAGAAQQTGARRMAQLKARRVSDFAIKSK